MNFFREGGGEPWGFEQGEASGTIEIKSVNPADYESEIVDLYRRAYKGLEEYADTDIETIKRYLGWLHRRADGGFLVAFDESRIVGFVSIDHKWLSPEGHIVGEIHEILVDPDYRGKRIGKLLLEKAVDLLAKRSVKLIELWAGEKNFHAQNFYKSQGFEEKEKRGKWIRFIKNL